jgi:hypothetical protein
MPELESRVSVLEAEQNHVKETLKELKEKTDETYDVVYSVKENQDKQNGILPKIWEKVETMGESLQKDKVKQAVTSTKVKIMWGLITVLGGGVVSLSIRLFILYICPKGICR